MRHRYYDSALGRFTQRDPIGFAGGLNLHSYVANNPVNASDPEGLELLIYGPGAQTRAPDVDINRMTLQMALDIGATAYPELDFAAAIYDMKHEGPNFMNGIALVASVVGPGLSYARAKTLCKDAHHFVQHAAVRDLPTIPGHPSYSHGGAPAVHLEGPSTLPGSEHYLATRYQDLPGGGTLGAELRIGFDSLLAAKKPLEEAMEHLRAAENYFYRVLGHKPSTPTRIPGNRR